MGEEEPPPRGPEAWPSVCALVPARDESKSLPHTLPALLGQDYPGDFTVILFDDRSEDGTADVARKLAEESGLSDRLSLLSGADLPEDWVGKVWALEQAASYCGLGSYQEKPSQPPIPKPKYLLLTDADIRHTPASLRRLVSESESDGLALNSRMARLRSASGAERLLIPPFVLFFNMLYPMRRVNDRRSSIAAAAGGCVLLASSALEDAGGFCSIKDEIIDDVNLARVIKRRGFPIRLALSRTEVESIRVYESLGTIWAMIRRTAFTELGYSWLRLAGTLFGMAFMFLLPPLWALAGVGLTVANIVGWWLISPPWGIFLAVEGFLAWVLMAMVYLPAVDFFGLRKMWLWTLPLAGVIYEAITLDSALQYLRGRRGGW